MMAWLKLHTDILADPKLMRAGRRGATHLVLLPWLLAFAKAANKDGALTVNDEPAEPEDLAALIPATTAEQVQAAIEELTTLRILERDPATGIYRFTTWGTRQSKPKPSDAPEAVRERVRKTRERKRHANVSPPVTPDVSPPVTPSVSPTEEKRREVEGERAARDRALAAAAALQGVQGIKVALTIAANDAITRRFGEQPTQHLSSSGTALETAQAIADAGVPLDFACNAVAEMVDRFKGDRLPRSLSYFLPGILDEWKRATDPGRGTWAMDPKSPGVDVTQMLWRVMVDTGIHSTPLPQREAVIASAVASGVIADERAFREAWGTVHLRAREIVQGSREETQLLRQLRAAVALGKQEPLPAHLNLPHPWLDWPGRVQTAEVAA